MVPRPTRGYARAGLVIVIVAAVMAVAFGTAYKTTRAVAVDDSAWLRKGVTIAHINGPAGREDAVVSDHPQAVAGALGDPLEVVQEPNGQLYTADPRTGKVFRIDLNTMTPQRGPVGTAVLAAGSKVFVVNGSAQTVTAVDPQTLVPGKPVHLPGPVASQAIAPNGTVYVGETDGKVTAVNGGQPQTTQVAPAGDPLSVAVVGSTPIAVDPRAGALHLLAQPAAAPISLPGIGMPELDSSQPDGPLWMVLGGRLISVNLANDSVQSVALPAGGRFGPPAANADRVYVPDEAASAVDVYAADDLAPVSTIAVPGGAASQDAIEVVVHGGEVWIDNPTSRDGKMVDPSGAVHLIDKGTGDEVVDPNAPAHPAAPPTQSAAETTTSSPAASVQPVAAPPAWQQPPVIGPAPSVTPSPASSPLAAIPQNPPTAPFVPSAPAAVPAAPSTPNLTTQPQAVPTQKPPTPSPGGAVQTSPSSPTSPSTSSTSSSTTSTTKVTATPGPKVPGGLVGQNAQAACAQLQMAKLQCASQYLAQAGATKPDIVASTSPPAGTTVTAGSVVTLAVDELQVPAPGGAAPSTYCATADAAGFVCVAQDQGPGVPVGVVLSTNVSGYQKPGTQIIAAYHGSPPSAPNCIGQLEAQCAAEIQAAGLTPAPVASTNPSVACDVVFTQTQSGTTVTFDFNPYCAQPFGEWHRTDVNASTGSNIWYLGFAAPTSGGSWTEQSYAAYAYPPVGGGCPAGLSPLDEFIYPTSSGLVRYTHYYFTRGGSPGSGWVSAGVAACVYSTAAPGSAAVYGRPVSRAGNYPADWVWDLGGFGSLVWYQPTRA